jgi:uncharacterized Zn-binding protein involved in type VI secretion
MQPLIVLGDKTSHGGTVITCSSTCDTHGKGWARIGDQVSCPRCKGIFPISEGDATLTDNGVPVAYHGCKVACGATLIASQQFTLTDPAKNGGGVAAETANDNLPKGFGLVGAGKAAGYEEARRALDGQRFAGRFRLLDAASNAPIPGHKARIRSTGGAYLIVETDNDGYTPWIERAASGALAFDLAEPGNQ